MSDAPEEGSAAEKNLELEQLFELRFEADIRAIKRWQAAGPGRELRWPDHADMVVWLLDEADKLRAALKECADDLAAEIEARFNAIKRHPAMEARYERDMTPVKKARELL